MHHVDLPEQVVTPGEELWVKIIDIDLQRRRISLSIKQAAEGGEVSEEYREAFGEHAYDEEGNYIGFDYAEGEFTPETEAQAAWADYVAEHGPGRRRLRRAARSRCPPRPEPQRSERGSRAESRREPDRRLPSRAAAGCPSSAGRHPERRRAPARRRPRGGRDRA